MCIVDMEGIHEGLESMSAFIRSSPRDSVISASSAGHSASTEKLAVSAWKGVVCIRHMYIPFGPFRISTNYNSTSGDQIFLILYCLKSL